ncbi:MAG: TrkH family potassium uptake protein [Candidatus Aenigmarchaeota archaeon]|nr:TrkH family potassium uptake protein [Candidatus Aenigmarchaeota archaeon]
MRPVLANLGFVLQIGGFFITLPVAVAFFYNETQPLIAFFITGFALFILGFLLNAFSERKEMDIKSSSILITATFFLLGLFGSIPYFYINMFNDADIFARFTNNYFESISGYTTTGFSLLTNIDSLPKSIVFYRGLTQFIGGLGIVFILLAFFYKGDTIDYLRRVMGLLKVTDSIKKSFLYVLAIYSFYIAVFTAALYFLGFTDLVNTVSVVFGSLMTGGLSPVSDFSRFLVFPANIIIILSMFLGATTFAIHFRLLTGKFRKAMTSELIAFILIILGFTALLTFYYNIEASLSLFTVVSASSTTGYSTVNISAFSETLKIIFVFLMIIGGTSVSTAGGMKILRLLVYLKAVPWAVRWAVYGKEQKFVFDEREFTPSEIILSLLVTLMALTTIVVSAVIFTAAGFPFINSLFESASAFATAGLSTGIVSLSLAPALKWLLALVMILGRIEIIPFLIIFTRKKAT